jgi:hypothetical protein
MCIVHVRIIDMFDQVRHFIVAFSQSSKGMQEIGVKLQVQKLGILMR